MRKRFGKAFLGTSLRAVLAIAMLYMFFRWFEHNQVYHPTRGFVGAASELGRPFEDVRFAAGDGVALHGWYFPANASSPRGRLAVLLVHGNGGNISYRFDHYALFLELGLNVFSFDYRGYGQSEGRPSEEGTYRDAVAAYDWLASKGFSEKEIVVVGESLGGAVGAELALRRRVAGLVLQNTFTSIPDIGAELFPWLPVRWISTIKYGTLRKLPRLRAPVLVMHSREDTLVRFHHGERNFAAANEPKLFWELVGDHNETLVAGSRRYAKGIEEFLRRIESGGAPARANSDDSQ